MSSAATVAKSRMPPSVTIPAAPSCCARRARMSPTVPVVASPAGLDHEHLARRQGVERALLRVEAAAVRREQVRAERDETQGAGAPDHPRTGPARAHSVDRDVVVAALAQLGAEGRGADARERIPQLVGELGTAPGVRPRRPIPTPRRAGGRRSAAVRRSRRAGPCPRPRGSRADRCSGAPAADGASTSISTVSPGCTTVEPAGVPVRMTSPGSRVMSWDRSATSRPNGNTSPAVVSSCTRSPFTQVRMRRAAGSSPAAGIAVGPSGVNPSPPFERRLEPLSAQRRS